MTAFIVFTKEQTTDQAELDRYSAEVGASFPGHDVRFLATYGAFEVLEGPPIEGSVILEFPDMDAARAWYWSPAYQEAAKHRFSGAAYRAFIVEGRSV
jgi:uncharacterized protein (DUF1330 family)